ncbi:hypothetical protein [Roseobacter sp.]|uniref:hypothetical protein n=1 Tax=Roseobacter sp. TaxID=1907202 RepID=UPI00329772F8
MQIVDSTILALLILVLLVVRGPFRGFVLVAGVLPLGMMAAVNLPAIGGTSVLAVDLAVLTWLGLLMVRGSVVAHLAAIFKPGGAGFYLMLFMGYAVLVTLFAPRVFAGETQVFGIGRIANTIGIVIRPLMPSGGNLSQLLRMGLSFTAFVAAAMFVIQRPDHRLILKGVTVVTVVHIAMGALDLATNAAGTEWMLSPVRTANYTLTLGQRMAGLNRMIGGFPEASAYGYFTLGLFGFWLSYWMNALDRRRWHGALLLALLAVLLRGTSSSAYVAGALVVGGFFAVRLVSLRHGMIGRPLGTVLVLGAGLVPLVVVGGYVAYETMPQFQSFLDRSLFNKLGSDSGIERMSWNLQAWANFKDTLLFGAGLGSVRASNWVIAVLATTGVPGAVLMAGFLWRLLVQRPPVADDHTQVLISALKLGCLATLARAIVVKASPNLDFSFFIMSGLLVGYAARAVTTGRRTMMPTQHPEMRPSFEGTHT